MTAESKDRDLFIVDNSVSGWTGLRYLEEWSGIAKAFDIATGSLQFTARPTPRRNGSNAGRPRTPSDTLGTSERRAWH